MSIKGILEELISQGWFGKVTSRTEGKFFDDKEDVDKAVTKATQAILAEVERVVDECEKYNVGSNINKWEVVKISDIKAKLHSEGL